MKMIQNHIFSRANNLKFGSIIILSTKPLPFQLNFHQKPCAVLNVNGYYDALLTFLDRANDQEFLTSANRNLLLHAATPEDLLALMLKPNDD